MKKTNVNLKSTELFTVLEKEFTGKMNKARIRFIALFILALCKARSINLTLVADSFESSSKSESSYRRIQRFIADFSLSSTLIAKLIFNLLPNEKQLILTIDRTNWKFGDSNINILMLGIVYKGVAIPILFKMLDKRGNSKTSERIELIRKFTSLFGEECIDCLVADREFIGKDWIRFLNNQEIKYYIRIRNNFKVFIPHKNKEIKAFHLFNRFKVNEFEYYDKIVKVNNQLCYLSGMKLKNKEFLILISFNQPEKAKEKYKTRWQIEMTFRAMKTSGFNFEKTHVTELHKLEKLILLTMVAMIWCYKIGIFFEYQIKMKSHGRRQKTIFKHGLDILNRFLENPLFQIDVDLFSFLSCT